MNQGFLAQASGILRSIHSRQSFDRIADEILRCAVEASQSDHGSFIQVDWTANSLQIIASYGSTWTPTKREERLTVGCGITGQVAQTGEVYNCPDVRQDPHYVPFLPSVVSELSMPILVEDKVWGILNLDSDQEGHYDSETVQKMELMSVMVASALDYRIQIEKEKTLSLSLAEAEKLSSMGQLVAGIAHEINNPLAAIQGTAELFRQTQGNSEFDEALSLIRTQAKRAGDLVKQLLSFARSDSQEAKPIQDAGDVVREAIDLVRPQTNFSGVELIYEAPHGGIPCKLNRTQIQQIVVNLITNAQQAITETKISGGRIEVGLHRDQEIAVVRVADNGPGMTAELLGQVFEPFFTTKEAGKGTGLGLSISKDIAQAHRGNLRCVSQPGKGCEFFLSLPLAEPEEIAKSTPAQEGKIISFESEGQLPSILVIDDEAPIRWMLKRVFTPRASRLVVTGSAEHGLEQANECPFDLIISDLHLPGIDGIELWESLGRSGPSRFVLITGDATSPRIQQFATKTGVVVVSKPFELDKLLRTALQNLSMAA